MVPWSPARNEPLLENLGNHLLHIARGLHRRVRRLRGVGSAIVGAPPEGPCTYYSRVGKAKSDAAFPAPATAGREVLSQARQCGGP